MPRGGAGCRREWWNLTIMFFAVIAAWSTWLPRARRCLWTGSLPGMANRCWLLPGGLGRLIARTAIGEGIAMRHFKAQAATVRGRSGGERMQSAHNRPSRALKNLLQEHTIPPWERQRMPLVFFGDRLAWVPGIGVAIEFRAASGEVGVHAGMAGGGRTATDAADSDVNPVIASGLMLSL